MEPYTQQPRKRSCYAPLTHSQPTLAQTTNPWAPNPQADFPQGYYTQGYYPQANVVRRAGALQANFLPLDFQPAAYSQGTNPQANFLPSGFPSGVYSQAANLQGPVPTPGCPTVGNSVPGPSTDSSTAGTLRAGDFDALFDSTPGFGPYNDPLAYQQPQVQQQPQAQQQPQEPLTFEQKKTLFLIVPEALPDPNPKPGPGRKKKNQRFWPPPNATDYVGAKFEQLQNADEDVTKAEERLASNKNPQKTKHFQDIVLRNMHKRQKLWTQCERLLHGKPALELSLTEAETGMIHHHNKCQAQNAQMREKITELRSKYPRIVQADNSIDRKQLSKAERQSLSSCENWIKHNIVDLQDYYYCLDDAQDREYGKVQFKGHLHVRVKRIHELGVYDHWGYCRWRGESPLHVALRQEFSNPDPSTWSTEGPTSDWDPYYQARADPQVQPQVQPEVQPEVQPAVNHGGLGQPAVFDGQQNQDQMGDDQVGMSRADEAMQPQYEGIRYWDEQKQELPHANPELDGAGLIDPALLQVQPEVNNGLGQPAVFDAQQNQDPEWDDVDAAVLKYL